MPAYLSVTLWKCVFTKFLIQPGCAVSELVGWQSKLQLDHCSHSNSAGHYCGINIVKILNSGRISSLVFPQRVARNIFFLSRPQNVWRWKILRWPIFPVGWLPPNWGNIKEITCRWIFGTHVDRFMKLCHKLLCINLSTWVSKIYQHVISSVWWQPAHREDESTQNFRASHVLRPRKKKDITGNPLGTT
mgnify:CR=1 FL=1